MRLPILFLVAIGCSEVGRPLGEACRIDSDCQSGSCHAGTCDLPHEVTPDASLPPPAKDADLAGDADFEGAAEDARDSSADVPLLFDAQGDATRDGLADAEDDAAEDALTTEAGD